MHLSLHRREAELKLQSIVKPHLFQLLRFNRIPNEVRDDNYVEISISDTGTGIPQNQIDKIFDRFYQVDGSHTREHEGTGIGLALTKELVDLHKGKIEVESEEGKGSTFRIIFPLGKDHLKPDEICDEETPNSYRKGKADSGT